MHRLAKICLCGTVGVMLFVPRLQAIDPVPPSLQNAPREVQREYLEQKAKQALRDKIAIGQKRDQERIKYKQSLVHLMREDVAAHQAIMEHSPIAVAPKPVETAPAQFSWSKMFLVFGIVGLGVVLLRRHFAGAGEKIV